MITFLLIISLLLHGVTALWILALMKKSDPLDDSKRQLVKLKGEIEDLLLAYTVEMKEENEKLLRQLEKKQQAKIEVERLKQNKDEEQHYEPPIPDDEGVEIDVQTLETAKVLALANEGNTIDQIAQKLNMGKGEVALIINFHKKA